MFQDLVLLHGQELAQIPEWAQAQIHQQPALAAAWGRERQSQKRELARRMWFLKRKATQGRLFY